MAGRGRRWLAVGLLGATSTLAIITAVPAGHAAAAGDNYVALGDSYVSGPLIPNQLSDANDPLGRLRSSNNYPHDVAAALGLQLTDMSCAGATTGNMNSSQDVTVGTNPPQLSAVTSGTQVVTLSIGGNDIGFSSIVGNCMAETPTGPTKVGQTCQDYYDANGDDQIADSINNLAPEIASILQQIHGLAPTAKVFVVGYPAILPPGDRTCWPSMPFEASDVVYLRAKEVELDKMVQTEAKANGAYYVNTYSASIKYNVCTKASTRWVEPIFDGTTDAAPVHPDALGMSGEAGIIEKAMKAHGIG